MLWSRFPLDIYGLFKMLFDCLWDVVDVFGLNTGNTGKPFFKILNEYSSSPAILKLSGKGHMPCQSLEIRQVVQQDNRSPEPEEPREPEEPDNCEN